MQLLSAPSLTMTSHNDSHDTGSIVENSLPKKLHEWGKYLSDELVVCQTDSGTYTLKNFAEAL